MSPGVMLNPKPDPPAVEPTASEAEPLITTTLMPYPHPILMHPTKPVTDEMFEDGTALALVATCSQMRKQLAALGTDSYAIAAPQIDIPYRLFVWDEADEVRTLINPEVVEQSIEQTFMDEECLSFLGKWYSINNRFDHGLAVQVRRSQRIVVRGWTVEKEWVEIEAVDFFARMLQHEIDHLDGITMIDRLSRPMRRAALSRWYKMHPELAPADERARTRTKALLAKGK